MTNERIWLAVDDDDNLQVFTEEPWWHEEYGCWIGGLNLRLLGFMQHGPVKVSGTLLLHEEAEQ